MVSDGGLDVVHQPKVEIRINLNLERQLQSGFIKLGLIITPALPSEPGSAIGLLRSRRHGQLALSNSSISENNSRSQLMVQLL